MFDSRILASWNTGFISLELWPPNTLDPNPVDYHRCNPRLKINPMSYHNRPLATVVRQWLCGRVPDLHSGFAGLNLSRCYFAPRSTQPSILPGSVNENQL